MGCTISTPAEPMMVQSLAAPTESKEIVFTDRLHEYGAWLVALIPAAEPFARTSRLNQEQSKTCLPRDAWPPPHDPARSEGANAR